MNVNISVFSFIASLWRLIFMIFPSLMLGSILDASNVAMKLSTEWFTVNDEDNYGISICLSLVESSIEGRGRRIRPLRICILWVLKQGWILSLKDAWATCSYEKYWSRGREERKVGGADTVWTSKVSEADCRVGISKSLPVFYIASEISSPVPFLGFTSRFEIMGQLGSIYTPLLTLLPLL